MNIRQVLSFALLLLILLSFGCTGGAIYKANMETGPNRFGCEGETPSPYPPYCHPHH
ncbi:hypothetical protein DAMNIGENAA_26060 [Desulforhabdus amnigena]|uniref:Lipoprotein n=1 Tax=Desulforhabdus amnigena TaxID=40218 RepID=A0A9W6L801_9BACT|nr:hypothetical protein DAMNIGENAA_26060 [Desulforhabdus amnigena]